MKIHSVKGGSGVNLHVREWGKPTGVPILLIHGWSQNHLIWMKQYESELLNEFRTVALDLRGHGMSDAPLQAAQYTNGDNWADDIEAIIDQLALDRPTLVGWSYGGFIISDYVRKHGQGKEQALVGHRHSGASSAARKSPAAARRAPSHSPGLIARPSRARLVTP